MDPLAGLGANNPGQIQTDEKDVFDVNALRYNLMHVDTTRSVMNIASGCLAGICGLTGWQGLGKIWMLKHRNDFCAVLPGVSLIVCHWETVFCDSRFCLLTMNFDFCVHFSLNKVCFLALHLSVLTIIWITKLNCNLRSFTRQSLWSYATANVQQSGLSFMLFWTLFYGLVYLY